MEPKRGYNLGQLWADHTRHNPTGPARGRDLKFPGIVEVALWCKLPSPHTIIIIIITIIIIIIIKVTSSREVTSDDIQRVAAVAASKPTAQLPESVFLRVLGNAEALRAPPQTGSHSEEYERTICENKAFAILNKRQAGKTEEKCWWQ